jgi:hypothetical protein
MTLKGHYRQKRKGRNESKPLRYMAPQRQIDDTVYTRRVEVIILGKSEIDEAVIKVLQRERSYQQRFQIGHEWSYTSVTPQPLAHLPVGKSYTEHQSCNKTVST